MPRRYKAVWGPAAIKAAELVFAHGRIRTLAAFTRASWGRASDWRKNSTSTSDPFWFYSFLCFFMHRICFHCVIDAFLVAKSLPLNLFWFKVYDTYGLVLLLLGNGGFRVLMISIKIVVRFVDYLAV